MQTLIFDVRMLVKTPDRRTLIIGTVVGIVVVGAGAVAASFALNGASTASPSSSPSATASPSVTPTPGPTELSASARVLGSIDGWAVAARTTVASVLPQVGDAATGEASVRVDAPVVDADAEALGADITVVPGATYDVSLSARVDSLEPVDVAATVDVGGVQISLSELDTRWKDLTTSFTAESDTVRVSVTVRGAVDGLSIDDVTVVQRQGADAANVVPNSSFEQITASGRIVNRSLVLPADRAVLAVRGAAGDATWAVTNASGEQIASGVDTLADGAVAGVPLDGVGQGYYTVSITDSAGTVTETPIAVIDMPDGAIPLDPRFGVGLHVENDYYSDAAQLASSLGFGLARNDILWRHNEVARGTYDFQPFYTEGFGALKSNGIHLLGIVNYGNALYGDRNVPSNPEAIAAYGRYAAAIAARFDLVGLEVFNEFNHSRFNSAGCGSTPDCYVPLLRSVHDAVSSVAPDLPIVAGSTANYDGEWFRGLWRAGGMQYADAVSYHPYQVYTSPENLGGIVQETNQNMLDLTGETRPIWITELGLPSTPAQLTVEQQAEFALRASITSLSLGVEHYFWYDLINDDPDPTVHEGNFGLFFREREGVAALAPKPSGFAYALLISQLAGLERTGDDSLGGDVWSVEFADDEGGVLRAVWAPGGGGEARIATDEAAEVVSSDGSVTVVDPVDGEVAIPVTTAPTFVNFVESAPTSTPAPSSSEGAPPRG